MPKNKGEKIEIKRYSKTDEEQLFDIMIEERKEKEGKISVFEKGDLVFSSINSIVSFFANGFGLPI